MVGPLLFHAANKNFIFSLNMAFRIIDPWQFNQINAIAAGSLKFFGKKLFISYCCLVFCLWFNREDLINVFLINKRAY